MTLLPIRKLQAFGLAAALVAAAMACGGSPENDSASEESHLEQSQCSSHCVGLTFAEKLEGNFYGGDLDSSPAHLNALDPATSATAHAELRANVADFDAFLASPNHQADLSGTVRLARSRDDAPEDCPVAAGSTLQVLVKNEETGAFEFRYHVRFQHGGEPLVLDALKIVKKQPGFHPLAPLEDTTTLFGQVHRETDSAELGVALLKFQVFQSLETLKSATRFLLSFEATGTTDPATKLSVLTRFNTFLVKILFEAYGPF